MWNEQPVPEAMARSPSRESFGTDLSLLSLSSLGSERMRARRCLLQVPGEPRRRPLSGEVLFEEEAAAPLVKSFSTADIVQAVAAAEPLRASVSELALAELPARLESRSCSTWVAVGDVASQLPSPQASEAALAPADLVRSVSTKVRQMYIRRRLLSTYRALERLTKSELDVSGVVPRVHVTTDAKLTVRDVQRDRGKPLTKYERNMMIFDWLQNLDQS
ncbi:hypothetical protein HPB50_009730 [Hyalomma asiaticum]|uniref:Uncharacterized protein n=1 Tax=Hyalomma asiaticum TaxID=266040 RepID=A0ACB7TFZ4_HYAAI|nr:hypothetical protein HPB50_009730 [Hyalomma asiaticum]